MSDADFRIDGFDEFVKRFSNMVDKWEEKKAVLLKRMGNIYHEEVIPLVPVDTSRLVDSIFVGGVEDDSIEVGTNVEYALYVNDGHVQHKRFLPIRYISAGGKKALVSKYGDKYKGKKGGIKGVMLQEKYIPGKHFMEKGLTNAKPRLETLVDSFLQETFKELEGGKL